MSQRFGDVLVHAVVFLVCVAVVAAVLYGFKQNDYRATYRAACEQAGGVYFQTEERVPKCVKRSAIVEVNP